MLGTLEFFILALIYKGIATPYEIQARASLSVGSTLPALRRLLSKGLVSETRGPKDQRQFSLTAAGKKELRSTKDYFHHSKLGAKGNLESTLRLASLAFVSGDHKLASEVLLRAADDSEFRAIRVRSLEDSFDKPDLASLYKSLLAECEDVRQQATAERLRDLAARALSQPAKQNKTVQPRTSKGKPSGTKGLS